MTLDQLIAKLEHLRASLGGEIAVTAMRADVGGYDAEESAEFGAFLVEPGEYITYRRLMLGGSDGSLSYRSNAVGGESDLFIHDIAIIG
jgi:hypothetical protein